MLTSKERAALRADAHHVRPIASIGKGGVSDEFVESINTSLDANELIKINILQNCDIPAVDAANELSVRTRSEVVQVIGKKITLYRKSTKKQPEKQPPLSKAESKAAFAKYKKFGKPKRVRQKSTKK